MPDPLAEVRNRVVAAALELDAAHVGFAINSDAPVNRASRVLEAEKKLDHAIGAYTTVRNKDR